MTPPLRKSARRIAQRRGQHASVAGWLAQQRRGDLSATHLAQRSGEPACGLRDARARLSRQLGLVTCTACKGSTHYAARVRHSTVATTKE